jgi:hypothetical protein
MSTFLIIPDSINSCTNWHCGGTEQSYFAMIPVSASRPRILPVTTLTQSSPMQTERYLSA